MKIAILFHEHPSEDLDLYFQLQGLKDILESHSIFIGPIPHWGDPRVFRLALSHYEVVLFGGLNADERQSFLKEAAPLGIPCIPFGSVAASYCNFSKVEGLIPRSIFFAGGPEDRESFEWQIYLYRQLHERNSMLWVSQTRSAFAQTPVFGINSLYSPRAPAMHLEAIGASSFVISCRLAPALLAAAKGIPALLVSFDHETTQLGERFGIPVLFLGKRKKMARVCQEIDQIFTNYPWPMVTQSVSAEINHFKKTLESAGVEVRSFRLKDLREGIPRVSQVEPLVHLCLIGDPNRGLEIEGLLANLSSIKSGQPVFHILSLEEAFAERLSNRFRHHKIKLYPVSELWPETEHPKLNAWDPTSSGLLSKARFLKRVLKEAKQEVFFVDPALHFFASVTDLLASFHEGKVGLFPQWRDDFKMARRNGLYETALMAFRPGGEEPLDWLEGELTRAGLKGTRLAALEQALLDFIPVFFEEVFVCHVGNQAVARWNLQTLRIRYQPLFERGPRLASGSEVKSFFAQSVDRLGIFETKVSWDQLVKYFGPPALPESNEAILRLQWQYSDFLGFVFRWAERIVRLPFVSKDTIYWVEFLLGYGSWFLKSFFRIQEAILHWFTKESSENFNLWEEPKEETISPWARTQAIRFQSLQGTIGGTPSEIYHAAG